MRESILVAGIGNIFLGDDGFGVEVAQRLARRTLPAAVRVRDFGIRGYDLAFALMDGYQLTILVDAARRGGAPGTLYRIEPQLKFEDPESEVVNAHSLDPVSALNLVRQMGGSCGRMVVVGCEPESFGEESDGRMGLSPAVLGAVEPALEMIEAVIAEALNSREVY